MVKKWYGGELLELRINLGRNPCKRINSFPYQWCGSELLEFFTFVWFEVSKPCKRVNSFPHQWCGSELVELGTFDWFEGEQTLQGLNCSHTNGVIHTWLHNHDIVNWNSSLCHYFGNYDLCWTIYQIRRYIKIWRRKVVDYNSLLCVMGTSFKSRKHFR